MADAVLVSSSFLPGRGGIESYLGELCDELAPRLAVVAARERDGLTLAPNLGYPVHPFDGRLLWPGRAAVDAVVAAAKTEGTDRVIFGTPWPLVLMGPRLRKRGLRYSVIVHGAEMLVPSAVPVVRSRLATALAGADLLLPVSQYTADMMRAFLERRAENISRTNDSSAAGGSAAGGSPGAGSAAGGSAAGGSPGAGPDGSGAGPDGSGVGPDGSGVGPDGSGAEGTSAPEGGDATGTDRVPPMELLRARVDLERFSPDVDDSPARRAYGIGPAERVVLCFGRLVPRKGVDRLIEALPEIVRRAGSTTVVVAGTGPESKKLRRAAARTEGIVVAGEHDPGDKAPAPLQRFEATNKPDTVVDDKSESDAGNRDSNFDEGSHAGSRADTETASKPDVSAPHRGGRVVFTGRVPDEMAPAVYAMADVFALPVVDRWFGLEIEGLGVVLLEAAAAGVPCVTGRSGGTPEAVIDGITGYVVDATDQEALVDRIATLLEHPEHSRALGLAGRTHVQENFSDRAIPGALFDWLE